MNGGGEIPFADIVWMYLPETGTTEEAATCEVLMRYNMLLVG